MSNNPIGTIIRSPLFNIVSPQRSYTRLASSITSPPPNSIYRTMQSDSTTFHSHSVSPIAAISFEQQLKLSTSIDSRGANDPPLDEVIVDETEAKEYQCAICMQIMVNPRQCKNGHLFCGSCIQKSIEKRPECPQCRDYLNLTELSRSLLAEKAIRNLKVYCKYSMLKEVRRGEDYWEKDPEGCPEIRTQEEVYKHESLCGYAFDICCWGSNCKVRKKDLDEHRENCPYRPVQCKFCNRKVIMNQLENHVSKCDEVIVSCPSCHGEFKRGLLQSHRFEECPEEFLQCPFARQGCDAKLRRRDFDAHTGANMANHLNLMHQYYEEKMTLMMADTKRLISQKEEQIRVLEKNSQNPIEIVWKVKDWSTKSKQFFLKSRPFEMANSEWYIGIYPEGLDERVSSKFVAIMLFMNLEVATRSKSITVKSLIRIINQKNPNETMEKDPGMKVFPIDTGTIGDEDQDKGYGSARFILLSRLTEEEGFLKDDTLVVNLLITKCSVKWDLITSTPEKVGWL